MDMQGAKAPQQTLSDIALRLNATLDLEKLLELTVNAASVLTDTEAAIILLPDESATTLTLRAFYDITQKENKDTPIYQAGIPNSIAGKVFKSSESVLIRETGELGAALPWHPVRSLLYIPMVSRRGAVGVLGVYNIHQDTEYHPYELKLLNQLAAHAAVAIENARIYADSQARAFEMALIIDAAEAVNSTLSLPHVLSLIGKNMLKALQANWCEVLILSPEQDAVWTLASQRKAIWGTTAPSLALNDVPMLERGLYAGETIRFQGTETELSAAEKPLFNGIRQVMLSPIQGDDRLLGVLALLYMEHETPALLPNAERISEMALDLLNGQPRKAMGQARQLLKETGAVGSQLWLLDDSDKLQLVLDESGLEWLDAPYPSRSEAEFPHLWAAARYQGLVSFSIQDSNLHADIKNLLESHQLQVLLAVPFTLRENNVGVVLIGDTHRAQRFENREVNLAQAMALQAANALKNAQLFEALQRSLQELRETQARLVETARLSAIGELASAVAHQINNPLTTVLADSQNLLSNKHNEPLTEIQLESLKAIHRAGNRAKEVVERLLTMARRKTGEEKPVLLDINQTILNTFDLVKGTLYRGRLDLQIDLAPDLPKAYGLPGQLEDVWMNILLNARDALRHVSKGLIGIQSRYNTESNVVEVCIWDNGPGIKEADASVMFGAFYTTKPPGEGTGLGLYICYNVIRKCGGEIQVSNSLLHGGAEFTVILPSAGYEQRIYSLD